MELEILSVSITAIVIVTITVVCVEDRIAVHLALVWIASFFVTFGFEQFERKKE